MLCKTYSITNAKGQFWQLGAWVPKLAYATKYRARDEAFTVIGLAARRFHACDVVPNPDPIIPALLPELVWCMPHKEIAEALIGISLIDLNDVRYPHAAA